MKALLLDDSETNRLTFGALLEDGEFGVTECGTLAEARRHLDRTTFEVVFLDLHLPDGLGTDLIPEVRRRHPRTVIVLLSGTLVSEAPVGADIVARKADNPVPLIDRVRLCIAGAGRPRTGERRVPGPKIMVIEDDAVTLMVVSAVLEDAGYQVVTRPNAFGATAAISVEKPDFLLLDHLMPGLSGEGLASILKELPDQRTKVIFHSSLPEQELEQIRRASGAVGAIRKSSDPQMLLAKLQAIIAREGR